MTESNLKEMMIDDINEEAEEETTTTEPQQKLKWYLIDRERTFCKVWNMMITLLLIYSLFVTPYILVFPNVYEYCSGGKENFNDEQANWREACIKANFEIKNDETLQKIEMAFDIIYLIEIILNFFKRSRTEPTLQQIAQNYLLGYFVFDLVATVPCLFMGETGQYYILKLFRMVHVLRITQPLQLILGCALQKYSKKRQNDLTSFAGLILGVIYISHLMACGWLLLGKLQPCD